MEPFVSTLVLHPAVLIASGFDSLSSRQVRFLNAFRQHFASSKYSMDETIVLSKSDFELGGIGNPHASFEDPVVSFQRHALLIDHFPYLSRNEIVKAFYYSDLIDIWKELLHELFIELENFCHQQKRNIDYLQPTTQVLHKLYSYPIYQKIMALHLCGLGNKMMDAFNFIFHQFKKQQQIK